MLIVDEMRTLGEECSFNLCVSEFPPLASWLLDVLVDAAAAAAAAAAASLVVVAAFLGGGFRLAPVAWVVAPAV